MKAASVKQLKDELKYRSQEDLLELCLRLSKFKKENKELLSYLLFDVDNESGYIADIKLEIDEQFELINKKTYYFIKKSVRKILRNIKKYIRYSKQKETEVELLLYFCNKLKDMSPSMKDNPTLHNIFKKQVEITKKNILLLHEDLQYDFGEEIKELTDY